MITPLNKIQARSPCAEGWEKLLRYLGKTQADDEPLNIATVIDSNGLDDAIWCLRAVDGCDREIRLFAVWCARQVQHLMHDRRSIAAIDTAERYANGQATDQELADARGAAMDVAWDVAMVDAAMDVTWDAARTAAWAAAWAAARAAAWEAALEAQAAELRRICSNFPIATNPIQPCANG